MMIEATSAFYGLFAANLLILAAAILAILRLQRMLRNSAAFWKSPTGAALQMQSPAPQESNEFVIHEISVLQRSVEKLCDRERARPQTPLLPDKLPLRHAVRMAQHGASIEDLTRSCGLNIGEARLMRKLHAGHSSTAAAGATVQ